MTDQNKTIKKDTIKQTAKSILKKRSSVALKRTSKKTVSLRPLKSMGRLKSLRPKAVSER